MVKMGPCTLRGSIPKNGKYKIISFFAKRARGAMARFIIQNQLDQPEQLKAFDWQGYGFDADMSAGNEWVFSRRVEE